MFLYWYLVLVTYNGALASTPVPSSVFSTKDKCVIAEKVANRALGSNVAFRGFYCVPRMVDDTK